MLGIVAHTYKFDIFNKDFLVISWRRQWHPTPVLLPGESHEQRSLSDCSPLGHKELDTVEAPEHACTHSSISHG